MLLLKLPLVQKKRRREVFGRFEQTDAAERTGVGGFLELKVKLKQENKEALGRGAANQYLKPY